MTVGGLPASPRSPGATLRNETRELPEWLAGVGYALPALLLTLVLLAYPLGFSFWLSLSDVDFRSGELAFVGLDNYSAVIANPLFWPSLSRTVQFAIVIIVGTVILSVVFALAISDQFRGQSIFRSIMILPWSMSQVMLALTFGWIFNSTYGPLNGALLDLGFIDRYTAWFASGQTVLNVLSLAVVWNLVPFATVLLMGALQTVPEDLLRAGRADGAGPVRRFFSVTVPAIKDTILVVIVLATLNAFLTFAPILILTGGGPGTETTLLAWWGYRRGFRDLELGESAAIFYLMTIMLAVIAGATVTVLGRRRTE